MSNDFYPRSPCGERRAGRGHVTGGQQISIHALLAESDPAKKGECKMTDAISIHALLAESDTLILHMARLMELLFLSTLSLRRATAQRFSTLHNILISIHALLAESDAAGRFLLS